MEVPEQRTERFPFPERRRADPDEFDSMSLGPMTATFEREETFTPRNPFGSKSGFAAIARIAPVLGSMMMPPTVAGFHAFW
jgi:hypothetical protein